MLPAFEDSNVTNDIRSSISGRSSNRSDSVPQLLKKSVKASVPRKRPSSIKLADS